MEISKDYNKYYEKVGNEYNNIRYERIAKRLSITIEQAKKENEIKERLKDEVGIDRLIKSADYVIDGNKSINEIFELAKQYISE